MSKQIKSDIHSLVIVSQMQKHNIMFTVGVFPLSSLLSLEPMETLRYQHYREHTSFRQHMHSFPIRLCSKECYTTQATNAYKLGNLCLLKLHHSNKCWQTLATYACPQQPMLGHWLATFFSPYRVPLLIQRVQGQCYHILEPSTAFY